MFRLILITALLFSLVTACDLKILSSEKENRDEVREPSTVAQQILVVQFGNESIANQGTLVVEDDGKLTLNEISPVAGVTTTHLSQSEVSDLVQLFVDNGFLNMESTPLDAAFVDEPLYSVDFYLGDEHNQIRGRESGNAAALQSIIDQVDELMTLAHETAPRITLQVGQSEIVAGDNVELKLTITNASSNRMALNFRSSKQFDFIVEPIDPEIQSDSAASHEGWQWSDDRYYSQVTSKIELAAASSRSYAVSWDGRSNDGEQLTGNYAVTAKVMSTPGGVSPRQFINILPAE